MTGFPDHLTDLTQLAPLTSAKDPDSISFDLVCPAPYQPNLPPNEVRIGGPWALARWS